MRITRFIAAAAAVISLACVAAPTAHADIVRVNQSTFVAQPPICSCVTTIAGYVFQGMPYADAGLDDQSAVGLWLHLYSDPNYVPLPPVTSISTTTTVSGTVAPPGGAQGSSTDTYGKG